MWRDTQGPSLVVGSTDAGMFCEPEKEAALVVVIGLSKGHPGTGLYVHLVGCQNYLKHRLQQT